MVKLEKKPWGSGENWMTMLSDNVKSEPIIDMCYTDPDGNIHLYSDVFYYS